MGSDWPFTSLKIYKISEVVFNQTKKFFERIFLNLEYGRILGDSTLWKQMAILNFKGLNMWNERVEVIWTFAMEIATE